MYAEDTDRRSVKEDEQMPRNKYPEQTVEKILGLKEQFSNKREGSE